MFLSPSPHPTDKAFHFTSQHSVHSLTTSRLDYCSGLLANCSVAVRKRMQRIQDSAARLVCLEPARSHAAPLQHRLHWLPISKRIKYKQCVLMFDVFHGTAPGYLTDLCNRWNDHRLWSSVRGDFTVRRTRTHFAGGSFAATGPELDMGPFLLTQSNPIHQLMDPIQSNP